MKVRDVMVGTPAYCRSNMNLGEAVEILWERNCGILPVVDDNEKVIGVITDRDICIALGTRNRLPSELFVRDVAVAEVHSCRPTDEIRKALVTMAGSQVRRLPVVDAEGRLEGILSMDDVVLHAERARTVGGSDLSFDDVVNTLKNVYVPPLPEPIRMKVA